MRIFKNERQAVLCLDLVAIMLLICNIWLIWNKEAVGDTRILGPIVPYIRAGACIVFIAGLTAAGTGFLRFFFPVYALTILYWNRYFNFTSFFLIMISYHRNPRDGRWMFPIYIVDALFALLLNNTLSPAHAVIHFTGCAGIVILYLLFFANEEETEAKDIKNMIVVDEEEAYLLNGLADGKQQKELIKEGLHKSTISSKLNNLKTRYGCRNIEELVIRWVEQGRSNPDGSGPNPEHKNKP